MSDEPIDSDSEGDEETDSDGRAESHVNERDDQDHYQIEYNDGTEPPPSDQTDQNEVNSEQFDPNESGNGEMQIEFDPNDSGEESESEQFDPNQEGEKEGEDTFDPNDTNGDDESHFDPLEQDQSNVEGLSEQFDPNEPEGIEEQDEFNTNDSKEEEEPDQFIPNEDAETSCENINSDSGSTILLNEDQQEPQENEENEQDELEKEIEKELEKGVEAINKYLEEEAEFINAYKNVLDPYEAEQIYESMKKEEEVSINEEPTEKGEDLENLSELEQDEKVSEPQSGDEVSEKGELEQEHEEHLVEQHQVEQLIEESLETETEPIVNEEEIEKLQEMELEEQFHNVHLKEYIEELVEQQELEQKEIEKEQEEIEQKEARANELKEAEIERDFQEEFNEVEQHQVEQLIEESLETETEPIINEKEIENLQEKELEEQFETVHLKEQIEEIVEQQEENLSKLEKELEEIEQKEARANELKEAELEEEFRQEMNEVEQHQVEPLIEEALETNPEPVVNEEEIEKLQEMELEEQFQHVHQEEYTEELKEVLEEERILDQENESRERVQEEKKQSEYVQEKLEEQELDLELEYEERDEIEQNEVEEAIEQELETEAKPIIDEEKLEHLRNLEPEKQIEAELLHELVKELTEKQQEKDDENEEVEQQEELTKEEKITQIMTELDITPETQDQDNHEVITEKETVATEEQREEEEYMATDHQQELEEILEQNSIIEQETHIEVEQEEEIASSKTEEDYEKLKELYKQQTGKRPIYASQETKGFRAWLEEQKKALEKEKEEQKKEKKKEEAWKLSIKNWIVSTFGIDPELNSRLIPKLFEEYDELEELIKKYAQLYNKSKHEKLSSTEKNELFAVIKSLQILDPLQTELFLAMREMKQYLEDQDYGHFWNVLHVNRIHHHFFTILSQKFNRIKEAQNNEKIEEILNNWIKNRTEEELDPKIKVELEDIIENYYNLEKLVQSFMQMYSNGQIEKLSKAEQKEFKSRTLKLQKLDPLVIHLFTLVRAFKNYINNSSNNMQNPYLHQILNRFFFNFSKIHKNLISGKENLLKIKINLNDLGEIGKLNTFESYGLIYLITNIVNGKLYVGKTIQKLKRRMQQHLNEARHSRKKTFLVYAIKKYGQENFEVEILNFYGNKESLNQAEKFYIKKYKSNAFRYSKGYNMTDGGETFRILYGEEHPRFVNIDIETLKELLQDGFTISEMAEEFKVSGTVIQNRLNEMGFVNITEARKQLGGYKKRLEIQKSRMSQSAKGKVISEKTRAIWSEQRRGSGNPRFIEFNRKQLIQVIEECGKKIGGKFTLVDVGKELKTSKDTAMHKIKQILGMAFPEAKNQFYFAPKIKELINQGCNASEITNKLGYLETWSNKKIRELWGLSLQEATRRFRAYPKIHNDLLMSLVSENLSAKEIDEIFIKYLILNYTIREIEEKLEVHHETFYRIIKRNLGFKGLTDARTALGGPEVIEFFEQLRREKISKAKKKYNITKELINSMIESGLKPHEMAENIGCSKNTIQVKIRELFNKTYSKLRDDNYWKPLLKSLIAKNLSVNQMAIELNMKAKNLGSLIHRLFGTESLKKLREKEIPK